MTTTKKKEIIDTFKQSPKDSGSPQVQVALLTERISYLSDHLKTHKKDHATQVGLLRLVNQRRSLLKYLKRCDITAYEQLIKQLKLRK